MLFFTSDLKKKCLPPKDSQWPTVCRISSLTQRLWPLDSQYLPHSSSFFSLLVLCSCPLTETRAPWVLVVFDGGRSCQLSHSAIKECVRACGDFITRRPLCISMQRREVGAPLCWLLSWIHNSVFAIILILLNSSKPIYTCFLFLRTWLRNIGWTFLNTLTFHSRGCTFFFL